MPIQKFSTSSKGFKTNTVYVQTNLVEHIHLKLIIRKANMGHWMNSRKIGLKPESIQDLNIQVQIANLNECAHLSSRPKLHYLLKQM